MRSPYFFMILAVIFTIILMCPIACGPVRQCYAKHSNWCVLIASKNLCVCKPVHVRWVNFVHVHLMTVWQTDIIWWSNVPLERHLCLRLGVARSVYRLEREVVEWESPRPCQIACDFSEAVIYVAKYGVGLGKYRKGEKKLGRTETAWRE